MCSKVGARGPWQAWVTVNRRKFLLFHYYTGCNSMLCYGARCPVTVRFRMAEETAYGRLGDAVPAVPGGREGRLAKHHRSLPERHHAVRRVLRGRRRPPERQTVQLGGGRPHP